MRETQYRIKTRPGHADPSDTWYMPQFKTWYWPFWVDMQLVGEVDKEEALEYLRDKVCKRPAITSEVVWTGTAEDLCEGEK